LPYRADRTGLRTDHLPPPPVHRDVNRSAEVKEAVPARPTPGLPPRLPSRQNTNTPPITPPVAISSPLAVAPPAYNSIPVAQPVQQPSTNYGINQVAAKRLGNAGVSVPAFGIGSGQSSNPWHNEQSHSSQPKSPPAASPAPHNQLSELQQRFARLNSTSSATSQQAATPPFVTPAQSPAPVTHAAADPMQAQTQQQAQSTTWAEKQSAMRTAQSAYKDPSSVTVQDAASAARTANTFRDRHKDTIDAAGAKASGWNKKYNVAGRLGSFLEKANSPTAENPPSVSNGNNGVPAHQQPALGNVQTHPIQPPSQTPELTASISRKPPPPPPPKKPANMHGSVGSGATGAGVAAPPPVPLGTRPTYS